MNISFFALQHTPQKVPIAVTKPYPSRAIAIANTLCALSTLSSSIDTSSK